MADQQLHTTENDSEARDVAAKLLKGAADPSQVRTVTGPNGRVAFVVDDPASDADGEEPKPEKAAPAKAAPKKPS